MSVIILRCFRTEHTLHEMYLQLRRDIIDERLRVSRDTAYQLAALALQAEYGDRPSAVPNYFNTDHYMPHVRPEVELVPVYSQNFTD